MNNKLIVNHAGFTGDLLYCIPMLEELKEATKCEYEEFHIHTNVTSNLAFSHPNGNVRMTTKAAEFIKPLLEQLNLFEKVTYDDIYPGTSCLDLSQFINLRINFMGGNIQEWIYSMISFHLPQDFQKKRISVKPNDKFKDRILLVNTERYNNVFLDLKVLNEYKDNFVFIGLPNEYEDFKKNWFDVEYYKISDALEFAEILAGAKGIISNQTSLYAIAELMKVPRILMSAEYINANGKIMFGPTNVIPQGGWFEVATTTPKLKFAIDNLLDANK